MIPKIIHQIYFNLFDKELEENDIFLQSHNICKNPKGYEYMLWDETSTFELLKNDYPSYIDFYNNLRYDIQRLDFIRFCILHKYGGIYIDLDMIILQPLDNLLKNEFVFHNIRNVKENYSFIENDFIATAPKNKMWEYIMQGCVLNYEQKKKIKVYDTWKGRFVLQTTGPKFLARCIKAMYPNYKPMQITYTKWSQDDKTNYYIEDYKLNTWIKNKNNSVV